MTGDEMPDRRRHGYLELEEKLDAHAEAISRRFHKRFRGMLVAFAIIGMTSAIALAGFGVLLGDQRETSNQLQVLVKQNEQASIEIQTQRENSIRAQCQEQNARNRNTSNALIHAAGVDMASRTTEAEKAEVKRRRDVTLGLIDALAPVQDCDAKVKQAVQEPPPTKEP